MKRILSIAPVILFLTVCLNGQQFYPLDQPVLPPSPSSTSVMKFSAIPTGLSSGIIPVNIPLMTLPGRYLSASVGLSYHASGVKVAETPGPVGSNWGLFTGGLITRTMYSRPDEMSEGYLKWKQLKEGNWAFESDTIKNFAKGIWDSQPDVFHYMFPGHSGKFVFGLDENENEAIYTIPRTLLEIEWNDSDQIIEEFIVTAENGVKYYFGKSLTGDRSAIESASCEPFYSGGVAFDYNSAWYLLQVVSPTVKDTIDYYYSNASENVDYKYGEAHYYPVWSYPVDASITQQSEDFSSLISYSVPILDSIATASGKISCYHSGSRLDAPASRKIDSLALFNYYGDKVKSFHLDYTHFGSGSDSLDRRLALDELTELGSDGSALPGYSFTYYNGDSLPSKDTDEQDYWGFYNRNAKNYLYTEYWNQDGADRSTDTARVKFGLLNRIDFPSGGYKELQYESNYVSKKRNSGITAENYINETISADWDSITGWPPDTVRFFVPFSQDISIGYTLEGFDPNFKGYVYLYKYVSGGSDVEAWKSPTAVPQQYTLNGTVDVTVSSGEYYIKFQNTIPDQSADIDITYYRYRDFVEPYSTSDAFVGGSRIKGTIIHDDISAENNLETTYTFNEAGSSSEPSGILTDLLPNHHYKYRYEHGDSATVFFARFNRIHSLLFDRGYHIGYGSYQISQGNSNGLTEISVISPAEEINVSSEVFPYSYPTSAGWKRGQVSESFTYDSDGDPRKRNCQTYASYDCESDEGYKKIYGLKASFNSSSEVVAKDSLNYVSSWSHPVYQRSVSHTVSGGDSIVNEQEFFFDNPDHMRMTRKKLLTSDNDTIKTQLTYPLDYNSGSSDSRAIAITHMQETSNMVGVPIEILTFKNGDLVSASCKTFQVLNGAVIPDTSYILDLDEPLSSGSFSSSNISGGNFNMDGNYRALNAIVDIDSYNRVQEAHRIHGNPSVSLYGYNGLYPIATFSNASVDEIGYSSFECEQKGNLNYTDSNISEDTCAITGEKLLTGGSLSMSSLPSGQYFLTFWANTAPAISVTNSTSVLIDNGSVNRQGMRYYQYKITASGSAAVTISSISKIDEVRIYPVGSFVTTRTYVPLVGVSSQAGANSIPSYTTYDAFGRPEKIKDQDKYIIQEFDYNYANQ